MPTIVGILTFISMINTTSERLAARNFFICWYFSFYEQLKFGAQLSWAWKKFDNLGSRSLVKSAQLKIIFSYFFTKTYIVGTQKNGLNEKVHLITKKDIFKLMGKEIFTI